MKKNANNTKPTKRSLKRSELEIIELEQAIDRSYDKKYPAITIREMEGRVDALWELVQLLREEVDILRQDHLNYFTVREEREEVDF